MTPPTIHDVLSARRRLDGRLPPTPLLSYPALDAVTGVTVLVKHENLQPTGAFKLRGGLNLLAGMSPADRSKGVLGYSTGNHAQSLAYAAREFGAPCTIVMPRGANPTKTAAVRRLGAELVEEGEDFEAAKRHAEDLAATRRMRLVSAGDEPDLIAGVATAYLEIVEQRPDLDAIIVPVGGGSGAAGAGVVTAALSPRCRVIAVQSAASPAARESWRLGECVERPNRTFAEGLATGSAFALTIGMLRDHVEEFVLVEDAQIRAAQWMMLSHARTVAEAAAAASLAALLALRQSLAGKRVAIMCSGGNAGEAELRSCLSAGSAG